MNAVITKSIIHTNAVIIPQAAKTTMVDSRNCWRVGHDTFFISLETSPVYSLILAIIFACGCKLTTCPKH